MLLNEKHELSAGWRAVLQDGQVGCTLMRAGRLHNKLGCRKGQAGGLPGWLGWACRRSVRRTVLRGGGFTEPEGLLKVEQLAHEVEIG